MKQQRRTNAQIEQLEAQIVEVLEADNPQSVRHVFYRMTDPRLPDPVLKTELGYKQVQDRIAKMRRAGQIPYGWIADATRRGYHVDTFSSGGDFISRISGLYRGELWEDLDNYVEVWVESRSIAGVVQADCDELAVSLYPAGGFSSMTLIYESAQEIKRSAEDKSVHVIYIGDYDPAGVLIDGCIKSGLLDHGVEADFHRIAINEAQIAEYGLPTKPRKATDRRRLDLRETVEAEAMPAATLRSLLQEAVNEYIPDGVLDSLRVTEESERDGLATLAKYITSRGLDRTARTMEKLMGPGR